MSLMPQVLSVLDQALQLEGRAQSFGPDTPLLGALPELDSMGAVSLIESLESHFDVVLDDSLLHADAFSTVGTLCELIERALG